MSTDEVDASDMMSAGGQGNSTRVRFQDLNRTQQNSYQNLVSRGARYVLDGLMTVDECSLGQLLHDDQTAAEKFVEKFHDDIENALDDLGETTTERREREKNQETTTDPRKIDWARVWEESNVEPNKPLSGTQLALAIDVSEQTPVTDQGAERLIEGAVEAGGLHHFEDKKRYAPAGGVDS